MFSLLGCSPPSSPRGGHPQSRDCLSPRVVAVWLADRARGCVCGSIRVGHADGRQAPAVYVEAERSLVGVALVLSPVLALAGLRAEVAMLREIQHRRLRARDCDRERAMKDVTPASVREPA